MNVNGSNILLQLLLLVLGFILLIKGADWFVEGASKIADRFHIPQLVIGLTIVAFGTSAPEAAISITAALKNSAEITIGNVVGSNILNVLVIIGITACILPLTVQKSTLRYEIPFVIVITTVLVLLGCFDGSIGFGDGIILWAFFLVFLVYLLILAKKGQSVTEEVEKADANESMLKMILMTAIGLFAIVVGSDLTIDSATNLATAMHLSKRFIGLTIIAFGTSLPELITSITAGMKGKDDIAIGNIVGSNVFNILFVVGTTALITPVPFAAKFTIDTSIAIASVVLLFICTLKDRKIGRVGGILMLIGYVGYFIYLL